MSRYSSAVKGRQILSQLHSNEPQVAVEHIAIRTISPVDDYDTLPDQSLLKKNLGLQQHRYALYNGTSSELEPFLFANLPFDQRSEYTLPNGDIIRKLDQDIYFTLHSYGGTKIRSDEIDMLDAIERTVAPHGQRLVDLYFRCIHGAFPILHKKVFLEKYARTHRELGPVCLAGVYLSALTRWAYDRDLSVQQKPDVEVLERLADNALNECSKRPNLSVIQGGLLLLHNKRSTDGNWQLSSRLVALLQEIGGHLDVKNWKMPEWERGLRRRLSWSVFMVDKWHSLLFGRPSHINTHNWAVEKLCDDNFPENAQDEDDHEGSSEVEKGKMMFLAMVSLTEIISDICEQFYSLQATSHLDSLPLVLDQMKPIQLRLHSWHKNLGELLAMNYNTHSRKFSSHGGLHLAYYAAEISLHRVLIRATIRYPCDPSMIEICRNAAKTRLLATLQFVSNLKAEHIQAVWYFPSRVNFASIGTFAALLYLSSRSLPEADYYFQLLEDYRWTLRLNSAAAPFLEFALQRLDSILSHLSRTPPKDLFQEYSDRYTDEYFDEYVDVNSVMDM